MTASPVVPRHAEGLTLRQSADGAELLRQERPALALDPTALALWELCDGETTVEEMTMALCALFDAEPETIQRDIDEVLTALASAGVLEWVPVLRPAAPRVEPHRAPVRRVHDLEGDS